MGWSFISRPGVVDEISRLPLTHLSVNVREIKLTPVLINTLSKITHLDNLAMFNDLTILDHFTSLTHLSFLFARDTASEIFERFPKLKVLIYYDCFDYITKPVVRPFSPDKDPPGFVRMARGTRGGFEDWLADITDGEGIWGLAEEAIEKRKEQEKL
ncbi:hypothetical protein BDN72DRAFT_845146 [Pluteus cervinus]|uniref:Uncharacterized protein n=1 Tax=Pluteus cervinus TaxID=181527 RepID=A0ACD3AJY9_9AGAR|nr:hypothetical protein BDN72DRAFT_845146 [Pluteus cervinus]